MASALGDIAALRLFAFDRVLSHDAATQTIALLGSFPAAGARNTAIVRIERAALPIDEPTTLLESAVADVRLIERNDIYTWLLGWLAPSAARPDVKINIICPATDVHIRKYTAQKYLIVHETPALYERIVKPYIDAFPASRTKWVQDILDGRSEADKVLHRDAAYVLLPDMKWDLATLGALYLVAIAASPALRSLRDLARAHLPMLRSIRREARRVVAERWALERGALRMFVHYQPSYYQFHVHIVHVEYQGLLGMTVGQAHLLDDVISLLELSPEDVPSVFARMTLTYGLGDQHALYTPLRAAQPEVDGPADD
ncbi:scavenger mRNA decapping enzyme [Fomitopsis serialis]|uniref:scavenger mRNA decapping enzyme n=1 Tax=Fomitopsis serialis TaxID=139415 RepID=UPI0020084956|nr:scavenger mRNA decapping enzyme [Neoantrodia serialis]KAH9911666.1 scavenger mRNA decapping enzyme [Neoantrodia serialis]